MINQSAPPQTPKSYFKTLTIIHGAMMAGPFMFAVVTYLLNRSTRVDFQNTADPKLYLVPAFAVAAFLLGRFITGAQLTKIQPDAPLKEKIMSYQGILITRWALQEGGALFGIVSYFISGNFLFLFIALIALYLLWTMRPGIEQMIADLNLGYDEQIELDADSAVK